MLLAGAVRSKIPTRFPLLLAAIAILAIGIDVAQWLRAAPLWVDEEMIAINVRDRAFSELPGPLWLGQGAPLGWLFAQRAAILAFGTSELALRFLPLLFGSATIAAAAWVGARWLGRASAVLLLVLVSIAQWMSHYRFEVKHYSADAFFALLLPALAAWALEQACAAPAGARGTQAGVEWRWTRWWIVAALAQWFAYGALLVTPACALLLAIVLLRRHGVRAAAHFSLVGVVWLLSLGAHYALSLQYTHQSRHLREYWSGDVPPEAMGAMSLAGWIAGRLDELASNPGGTTLVVALWIALTAGLLLSRKRLLAAMFASVPLSAFVLAALRLVPLTDRLALWIVPALYVGVALLLDAGVRAVANGWKPLIPMRLALGATAAAAALYVSADIVAQGRRNLDLGTPGDSNHALDDRKAIAWLMARRQPGDLIMTTRLGWPAVWWYGGISLRRNAPAGRLPDGTVMLEVSQEDPSPGCRDRWHDALEGHRRVLVHVGFPDAPKRFYELLLQELAPFGTVVESARFSLLSRTAIVELHASGPGLSAVVSNAGNGASSLEGCVGVRPVRRW